MRQRRMQFLESTGKIFKMKLIIAFLLIAAVSPVRPDDRIVGGSDVTSTSLAPWQASLQKSGSHFCGGSIISETKVMSACHCRQTSLTVVVGTLQYKNPGQSVFTMDMECHPMYNDQTTDYDYSVITLNTPLTYNIAVQPIVVASQEYPAGTQALITGWGKTSGGIFGQIPDNLQYAYTNLISQKDCIATWGNQVTDRMQCVENINNSGCNGDSGGPLAVDDGDTWVLVGNTSWGSRDCAEGKAAAWSKNSAVYSWIQSQM